MVASLLALLLLAGAPAPAVVSVENRTIFTFGATLGGLPPAERARLTLERVDGIPLDAADEPVSVRPYRLGDVSGHAVLVGGRVVFAVVDGDVDALAGQTTETAASAAAARLSDALRARRDQRSLPVILRGVALSAGATLLLALVIWLLLRFRALRSDSLHHLAELGRGQLAKKGLDLRPLLVGAGRALASFGAWALLAALLDVWLTFVLGCFPATRPWADALSGKVLGIVGGVALAALEALPGLVAVALILAVADVISRFLKGLFDRVASGAIVLPGLYPETVGATRRIATALVWIAALAAAWPYVPGASTDAIRGLGLIVGVMVSLGSTGLMSQAMAGLVIVYSRALAAGDYVRAGETEGVVTEVGLISTKVATMRGEEVTIPNAVLVTAGVKNFTRLSRGQGPLVSTTVTIGYDAPWRKVEALLLAAASRTAGLRADARPFVLQRSLSDFYVEYELVARLDDPMDRPQVLSTLHANIQDAFNEAGLQIMSPHFMVQPEKPVLGRG